MASDHRINVLPGCRICHEDEVLEELIEPCECSGTLGLIHASCLEKWLSTSNTNRCEICKFNFAIERRNKPLSQQSFQEWWRSRGIYGPQGITGDMICLIVLTPLCMASTYLCGVGASAYARHSFWESTGLAILCCTLVVTYFLWLFVTIRFHYKSWKQWSNRHQEVKLLVKYKLPEENSRKNEIVDDRHIISNINNSDNDQRGGSVYKFFTCFSAHQCNGQQNANSVFTLHQQTPFI